MEAKINDSGQVSSGFRALHGRRFAMFGGVGVINTIVDFLTFAALVTLSIHPALANIGAFFVANLGSYFLNAKVTFRSEAGPAAMTRSGYLKFSSSHLVSLAISTAIVVALSGQIGPFAAKILAIPVALVLNYAASTFLVFRDSKATKTQTERESL